MQSCRGTVYRYCSGHYRYTDSDVSVSMGGRCRRLERETILCVNYLVIYHVAEGSEAIGILHLYHEAVYVDLVKIPEETCDRWLYE